MSKLEDGTTLGSIMQHEAPQSDAPVNEDRISVPVTADSAATEMSGMQVPSVQGMLFTTRYAQ